MACVDNSSTSVAPAGTRNWLLAGDADLVERLAGDADLVERLAGDADLVEWLAGDADLVERLADDVFEVERLLIVIKITTLVKDQRRATVNLQDQIV